MKRFGEMNLQELEQIINRSKKMREKFESYIMDCEMDYISDKLSCVTSSLKDWTVGFWERNYITVDDYSDFVAGVRNSSKRFGCSDRLESLLSHCEKLDGTNLFKHYAVRLKNMWFEDEIQSIVKFVEDAGMELYGKSGAVGEKTRDYVECFFYNLEDWLYDEETETFYKPTKLDAA